MNDFYFFRKKKKKRNNRNILSKIKFFERHNINFYYCDNSSTVSSGQPCIIFNTHVRRTTWRVNITILLHHRNTARPSSYAVIEKLLPSIPSARTWRTCIIAACVATKEANATKRLKDRDRLIWAIVRNDS